MNILKIPYFLKNSLCLFGKTSAHLLSLTRASATRVNETKMERSHSSAKRDNTLRPVALELSREAVKSSNAQPEKDHAYAVSGVSDSDVFHGLFDQTHDSEEIRSEPTPRTKARQIDKDVESTLGDEETGFDVDILRRTYKNHFGASPNSTDPVKLRIALVDGAISEQITAGIDPIDIMYSNPAFQNLLKVVEMHEEEERQPMDKRKGKRQRKCNACSEDKGLVMNPDGRFWCSSCWESEDLRRKKRETPHRIKCVAPKDSDRIP